MNNDISIVIKSQSQPDGGEGYSAGQAVRGNAYGEEGLSANVRGDAQEPSEASPTRDESASQDEVLYSSYEEGRILGARARKVNKHTPGDPLSVTPVTNCAARHGHRLTEVSREHSSRRSSEVSSPTYGQRNWSSCRRVSRPTKSQRSTTPTKARTVPRPNGSGK